MSEPIFPRAEAGGELATAIGLLIVAMLVLAGFLLYQAIDDHRLLLKTLANQEQPLQQARQIKAQLGALSSGATKLAEQGDATAKQVIDELRKQGIHIEP